MGEPMPSSKVRTEVGIGRYESAADWPAWTDEERWAPNEDDARWAAENLNGDDWHDQEEDVPDESLNRGPPNTRRGNAWRGLPPA